MIPTTMLHSILDGVDVADYGTGTVVALAHGAGGGVHKNFSTVIDEHRGNYRFVGPHYPGTAGTPVSQSPLDIDVLADQVVAAGLRAGADHFPVIGLSLGAAVAATAAVRHPEHISALVLTVGLAHQDAQIVAFTRIWQALASAQRWDALSEFMIYSTGTADELATFTAAEYAETVAAVQAQYPTGGVSHAELASRIDVTPLLAQIAVPTLVIVGGHDRIVTPSTARAFSRITGSQIIEYRDAGHIFTGQQAQQWARDIGDFLSHT
ncbi:MAG: alpha/beta hydrolase [Gordonia sp. (in: high G+C Gram-positive bacteria)]